MKQVQQCVCSGALQAAWLNAYLLVTFKYTMPTSKPHKVALMPKKDAPDRVIKKVSKLKPKDAMEKLDAEHAKAQLE